MSNVTMVFPNDIKVDANGNLWVLSDKLPVYMYSQLDPNDVNFRILTAPVREAIRGTACDSKLIVSNDISDRFNPLNRNLADTGGKSTAVYLRPTAVSSVLVLWSYVATVFLL